MLILERKIHQKIMLTGGIVISISDIDTKFRKVKIGIEAPPEIEILREELILRKENKPKE